MNVKSLSIGKRVAAVMVAVSSCVVICAAPNGAATAYAATTPPAPSGEHKAELDLLKASYHTLALGDHDYKGHRVLAMRSIEKACDILGSDIRGDGKGHEPQPISDKELHEAQQRVEKVRSAIPAGQQKTLAGHLDEAIKQIGIALTIK